MISGVLPDANQIRRSGIIHETNFDTIHNTVNPALTWYRAMQSIRQRGSRAVSSMVSTAASHLASGKAIAASVRTCAVMMWVQYASWSQGMPGCKGLPPVELTAGCSTRGGCHGAGGILRSWWPDKANFSGIVVRAFSGGWRWAAANFRGRLRRSRSGRWRVNNGAFHEGLNTAGIWRCRCCSSVRITSLPRKCPSVTPPATSVASRGSPRSPPALSGFARRGRCRPRGVSRERARSEGPWLIECDLPPAAPERGRGGPIAARGRPRRRERVPLNASRRTHGERRPPKPPE